MLIPHLFHRIWLGGKPMPSHFVRWGESWQKLHPSWKMKLWTEKEIVHFTNIDILPKCSNLAMRSDIIRYEVIYREGGVYLDPDMECLKNIEMLVHGVEFFGCWQRPDILSNAVFGSAPSTKIMQNIVWSCRKEFKSEPGNAMGPEFFTRKVIGWPGVRIYDRETFIPYTREQYKAFPKKPMIITNPPAGAYAINHRASLWYSDLTAQLPAETEPPKTIPEKFTVRVNPTKI